MIFCVVFYSFCKIFAQNIKRRGIYIVFYLYFENKIQKFSDTLTRTDFFVSKNITPYSINSDKAYLKNLNKIQLQIQSVACSIEFLIFILKKFKKSVTSNEKND